MAVVIVQIDRIKLRRARFRKGFTFRELGERSGVHFTAICRIEHGKRQDVTARVMRKLEKALGLKDGELLMDFEIGV